MTPHGVCIKLDLVRAMWYNSSRWKKYVVGVWGEVIPLLRWTFVQRWPRYPLFENSMQYPYDPRRQGGCAESRGRPQAHVRRRVIPIGVKSEEVRGKVRT